MSIEQANVVDIVSTGKDGVAELTIVDHLAWDEKNEHLLMLQDKLNAYLRFIESGEIYQRYPKAKGLDLLIRIRLVHRPSPDGEAFLNRVAGIIKEAGVRFDWRPLGSYENNNS